MHGMKKEFDLTKGVIRIRKSKKNRHKTSHIKQKIGY